MTDRNSPDRNRPDSEPGRRPEQILVVDDDWGIGDCVEILLGRAGYECVITRQGDRKSVV